MFNSIVLPELNVEFSEMSNFQHDLSSKTGYLTGSSLLVIRRHIDPADNDSLVSRLRIDI